MQNISNRVLKHSRVTIRQYSVHSIAEMGFGASNVDRYVKGRPSYSNHTLNDIGLILKSAISRHQSSVKEPVIVELGSGTGKFSKSFLDCAQDWKWLTETNFRYFATEPSDGFREYLANELVRNNYPHIDVRYATGSSIPFLKQNEATAVIVAQAFHWMATPETLQEIHR